MAAQTGFEGAEAGAGEQGMTTPTDEGTGTSQQRPTSDSGSPPARI